MNQVWWIILLLMVLGLVSYKAAKYLKEKRYGYGVGMIILAMIVAYQIMGAIYAPPPAVTPPGNTPTVSPPAEE